MDLDKIIWILFFIILAVAFFVFLPEIFMISVIGYIVYKIFLEDVNLK